MSFCIPSYQKAEVVKQIVDGLLVCDDARFEVVVNDNASTDNTMEILSQIDDPRFKLYRNDTNVGAKKNWGLSLELGSGDYLYLVMGRDKLNGESIPDLIDILKQAEADNIVYIRDLYIRDLMYQGCRVYDGVDAMIRFVDSDHPTGLIVKRDVFKSIPERSEFFDKADIYPMSFVACAALQKGKGACFYSGVWKGEFLIDYGKFRSTALKEAYYLPKHMIILFHEVIDSFFALHDRFSESEKNKYFRAKFTKLLYNVTTNYENANSPANRAEQLHYEYTPKNVGFTEMVKNIWEAYIDAKAYIRSKGIYSFTKQAIMCDAIVRKLCILSLRMSLRTVLGFLGLLKAARNIKFSLQKKYLQIKSFLHYRRNNIK